MVYWIIYLCFVSVRNYLQRQETQYIDTTLNQITNQACHTVHVRNYILLKTATGGRK